MGKEEFGESGMKEGKKEEEGKKGVEVEGVRDGKKRND